MCTTAGRDSAARRGPDRGAGAENAGAIDLVLTADELGFVDDALADLATH